MKARVKKTGIVLLMSIGMSIAAALLAFYGPRLKVTKKAKGNDYTQNASAIKCKMWEPSQRGVIFYSYENRMTHWKIALDVAEAKVFLGSYNLNHRSAMHDFELNVLVESHQLAENVKEMLENDMAQSFKITDANEFYQHPNMHPSCLLLKATEYFE